MQLAIRQPRRLKKQRGQGETGGADGVLPSPASQQVINMLAARLIIKGCIWRLISR